MSIYCCPSPYFSTAQKPWGGGGESCPPNLNREWMNLSNNHRVLNTYTHYIRPRRNKLASFFGGVKGVMFVRGKDESMNAAICWGEICCGKNWRRAQGVGGGIKMSHTRLGNIAPFFHIVLIHRV